MDFFTKFLLLAVNIYFICISSQTPNKSDNELFQLEYDSSMDYKLQNEDNNDYNSFEVDDSRVIMDSNTEKRTGSERLEDFSDVNDENLFELLDDSSAINDKIKTYEDDKSLEKNDDIIEDLTRYADSMDVNEAFLNSYSKNEDSRQALKTSIEKINEIQTGNDIDEDLSLSLTDLEDLGHLNNEDDLDSLNDDDEIYIDDTDSSNDNEEFNENLFSLEEQNQIESDSMVDDGFYENTKRDEIISENTTHPTIYISHDMTNKIGINWSSIIGDQCSLYKENKSLNFKVAPLDTNATSKITKITFDCPKNCTGGCRQKIPHPRQISMETMRYYWIWKSLNPSIIYHEVGRSSVGFLIDANIPESLDYTSRLAFNLMMLFSKDSAITISLFKTNTIPVSHAETLMENRRKSSNGRSLSSVFNDIVKKSNDIKLDIKDFNYNFNNRISSNRNLDNGIRSILDDVLHGAFSLQTRMKILFIILTGPINNSYNEMAVLGRLLTKFNLKIYIIYMGEWYGSIELSALTSSSRIFIVSQMTDLIYGGPVVTYIGGGSSNVSPTAWSGVIPSIQARLFSYTEYIGHKLTGINRIRHGYVGWWSDPAFKSRDSLKFDRSFPNNYKKSSILTLNPDAENVLNIQEYSDFVCDMCEEGTSFADYLNNDQMLTINNAQDSFVKSLSNDPNLYLSNDSDTDDNLSIVKDSCPHSCSIEKRGSLNIDKISDFLRSDWDWRRIQRTLRYSYLQRSSVGILVDGNINRNANFATHFIYNIIKLFGKKSVFTTSVFKRHTRTVFSDEFLLRLNDLKLKTLLTNLFSRSKLRGLGKKGMRNIYRAVDVLIKHVSNGSKMIKSKFKYIFIITNGRFSNRKELLFLIKKRLFYNKIKLFIINFGLMLDFNQLFILTPRSNVFVVRKLSDSIQEPKSYLDKDKNRNPSFKYINEIILRHGNENGGVIVGLSRTIKRFQQSNNYEHRKNNYKTTNNTEIPWNPDNFNGYINESRNRLDLSKLLNNQFSYDRTTNVSKSNQNYKFNRFKRSLDADSFSKLINLWNKLRARNKNPTANKFNRPYKSRPHFSPSNRPHPMTALNLTNSFINNLQNNWIWKPFVPDMDISVVGPANIIFVLDLDNRDQLPLIRRFLFNTMLLFPLPLTKFTILIHENMMLKEFLVRKTFSLAEDIMKMVLSLDFTHGKIFSIPYLPLFLQLSAQKDLFSKIKDVTIVYTTKASLDFMTYDKTGKKVAADFPILYILGASIPFPIQKMFFSQMANPNRLFLEATFDSLFSEKNLKQLVISLKKDLQTSNIILDLSNDSTNYGHSKRFPNSRNGNNNTKAKDNRKNNLKSRGEYKNRNGKFKKLSKRQVNRFKDYAASQSTSLGPANIIYLVDTTMNQQSLSNVKKMISGLINLYPRVGSYHSLIGFEDYPSRISTLEQLLSSGHINSVLNSLKKRGGNLRLTGQALSLAVNSFSSANPGLVNILFVIICGKSTDFYKQVALEAKRHGIVTIAINFGGPPDASTEAASIATTTQRAFYVNPSKSSNVPFKLKFFLETTSGSLKNPSNGIAQVINEWSWSSHDNFQLNKKISPSEISFLLDLTGSPRNVINLAFNLINRFSRQSLVSLHSIGHSGIGSEYYNKFYNMADLTVLQLVLQSFIGNSVPIPGQLSNLRRPFKKKDKVRFFERGSSVARLFPNYRPKSRLGTFESQDTSDFDVDYPDTESVGNEVRFSKKYTWCQITSRLQSIVKLYEKSEFVGNSGPVINRVLFLILSSRPVSKSTNDQSSDNCKNKELLFLTQSFKSYGVHLFVIDALRTVSVGSQFQKFKWNYYGQKWNSLLSTSKIIVDKLMKTFGVSTGFNLLFRDSNFDQFLSIKKHFSQSDYKILATDLSITSLVPTLAPPIDQLLTTKFLLKVDNLKKVWRWRNIIPGLKYENIDGDINVILMVDISRGWNFFAVQQAVINTIALFNGNSVRFSLITYSSVGKAKIVYLNKFYSGFSFIKKDIISNLNSDAMLNLKIRKTKLAGALSFIRRRVIKELRPAVSNLLIIISSSQSSTTQPSFNEANKLKNFGVIISVIGIGINYNPGELLRIASNGHLFVHSVESMLPVALFRLQFVFTAIFNEPFTKSGKLTISNLTPYEPKLTINIRGTLPLKGKPKNSRKQPELPTNSEPISFTPPPNVSSDSDNGNSQ